jgi:hypothetical protein
MSAAGSKTDPRPIFRWRWKALATGKAASRRTINQHCSVCKKDFDMEIVEGDESNDVIWLKCPGCEGFLPYMTDEDGEGADDDALDAPELAPEDLDEEEKEQASEYVESGEYEIDEIIYHRSWNDYGKVIAKEELPGHRKTIIVNFVNQGKIRLLEGVT